MAYNNPLKRSGTDKVLARGRAGTPTQWWRVRAPSWAECEAAERGHYSVLESGRLGISALWPTVKMKSP
ncbi:hypothetical protein W02_15700 [Nitrospira sp. KM1]|nr:hypothetical protein W02_15700 [Nitrospira sp. KM1]